MITVLTASSRKFASLAALTAPTKSAYAERWGYSYTSREHVSEDISLERLQIWREELEACDWLFFTGCDAAITNPEKSLEERFGLAAAGFDFLACSDGGGLNNDSWLMRNCPACRDFLHLAIAALPRAEHEQQAMQLALSGCSSWAEFIKGLPELKYGGHGPSPMLIGGLLEKLNRSSVRVKIIPQRALNAYPPQPYGGSVDRWDAWNPGDFVCHLPGISLERRLEFFGHILR